MPDPGLTNPTVPSGPASPRAQQGSRGNVRRHEEVARYVPLPPRRYALRCFLGAPPPAASLRSAARAWPSRPSSRASATES